MANDPYCDGCFYYRHLSTDGASRCCHYIFVTDTKRPCDPGKDCTVKVPIDVARRKRRKRNV